MFFFFCNFWLIFYPLDPDHWIRIFLRIWIKEAKIFRIQWIRILSTGRVLHLHEFICTLYTVHWTMYMILLYKLLTE